MSYKQKPNLKLYEYKNGAFSLIAIIDDYADCSFENNLYQAGQFTITINYNIANASVFRRGLFISFGASNEFGEILKVSDSIGEDGAGSQIRTITGYDARYLLKRRVIKNLNQGGFWQMTAKGELCLRNLIKDQCGSGAEVKRQLPIINTIPADLDAIGKEYSVSESFTNLYDVCVTIAIQSEIGWKVEFDGTDLTLDVFGVTDKSSTVKFDTSFESLANGEFGDSSESFANAIYIGGKGQNEERDIYEGEDGSPESLERFEAWDSQTSLTTEDEYEAEALSMLNQYGQTISLSGNGLARCPYIYKEDYNVGDLITVAFSGHSAKVQILSITEHWEWGTYDLQFQFGKPINDLSDQLNLILRQIQRAGNKTSACTSVKWYTIPTDTEMAKSDVFFDTIGFTGTSSSDTFTIYLDDEGTGAKVYNLYVKNLTGSLTLTTGFAGAEDLIISGGTYTGSILVDTLGNITLQSSTVAVNSGAVPSGTANTISVGGETYNIGGGGGSGGVPIGSIIAMHSSNPPNSNWLLCDGSTFDEDEYPALYMYLGSNVLPDLRECTIVGAGQNTTNTIGDHDVYTLGEFKDDQLQSHTHSYTKFNTRRDVNWSSALQIWVGVSSENTGTPTGRTGTTTHGKQVGENWFIKAVTSTPDSDFQGTVQTIKDYVDSKANYSTEEIATGGTWIDGKPIYRKVVTYNSEFVVSQSGTDFTRTTLEGSDVDNYTSITAFNSTGARNVKRFTPCGFAWNNDTSVKIFSCSGVINHFLGLILEYTKA